MLSHGGGAPAPFPDGDRLADSEDTGTIRGVRIEAIEEPLMREIRYLDKLVDVLAKGRRWGRCVGRSEGEMGAAYLRISSPFKNAGFTQ